MTSKVKQAAQEACEKWKTFFNAGDAAGCASLCEPNATILAGQFGTAVGRKAIEELGIKLIEDGFRDAKYLEIQVREIEENSAVISAAWTMNNEVAFITHELWVLQPGGTALLRESFTRQYEPGIQNLVNELRREVAGNWYEGFRKEVYPASS